MKMEDEKTPAEILEEAADIMDERGAIRSRLIDSTGRVCALGAIHLAHHGVEVGEETLLAIEEPGPVRSADLTPEELNPYTAHAEHRILYSHLIETAPKIFLQKMLIRIFGHPRLEERTISMIRPVTLIHGANDMSDMDMAHEMRMAAKKWREENE